jgi:hypothetical protein
MIRNEKTKGLILAGIKRDANEPEYLQAVKEVLDFSRAFC